MNIFHKSKKEKSDKDKINELYNLVINLQKENNILKEENINLKRRIENNEICTRGLIERLRTIENKINNVKKENNETPNGEEKKEEKELTPEEDLRTFLEQNSSYQPLFKMIKIGVTIAQVEEKARKNEYNMDLFYIMVEKAKKAYPNIY